MASVLPSTPKSEKTEASSATSLERKHEKVIRDLTLDDDDDAESSLSSSAPAAPIQIPPLNQITSKTLRLVFGIGPGRNPKYCCPVLNCKLPGAQGQHKTRARAHAQRHTEVAFKKMVKLEAGQDWSEEDETRAAKPASTIIAYSVTEADTKTFLKSTAIFFLEAGLPLSMIESPAFHDILQCASRLCNPRREISINHMAVSRKTFTKIVDDVATDEINRYMDEALKPAQTFHLTLLQDGRSNINMDPLIATGVQGRTVFVPLGTVNAAVEKKDIQYLQSLAKRYLDRDDLGGPLAPYISGICLDGSAANIAAMRRLHLDENLLVVRCQAHALSLVIKKIMVGHFGDTIKMADKLISFVHQHQRINSILKVVGGTVLFRFVETRFATHVLALERLIKLRQALTTGLINHAEYLSYKASISTKSKKEELRVFEETLKSPSFWNAACFAVAICRPVAVALRLMDRHSVRAQHGNKIWSSLGNHLAAELVKPEWEPFPKAMKRAIYDLYVKEWRGAYAPVLGAAFVLDPANAAYIAALRMRRDLGESVPEFDSLMDDLHQSVEVFVKRKSTLLSQSADFTEKMRQVKVDMAWYFASIIAGGVAMDYDEETASAADYWLHHQTPGLFNLAARAILCTAITTSDIERLHKVYSLVHTPARNRTTTERADKHALANLILRSKRCERKPVGHTFAKWATFFSVSPELEEDLCKWAAMEAVVRDQVRATIAASASSVSPGFTQGSPVDVDELLISEKAAVADSSEQEIAMLDSDSLAINIDQPPVSIADQAAEPAREPLPVDDDDDTGSLTDDSQRTLWLETKEMKAARLAL